MKASIEDVVLVVSHCTDWWEDGSGDMLFIREKFVDAFEEWAKQ